MMEQSNKLFNFCITISLYSDHNIHKFLLKQSDLIKQDKKKYSELDIKEQDEYLSLIFSTPLLSRNIKFNCAFEYHTNIVLKGNSVKRHLHGTIFNITKETMEELKLIYCNSYIRVKTEKAIRDCFNCQPIIDGRAWALYMNKEQENTIDEKYINDLQNHLESEYLDDTYKFNCLNRNICPIKININYK